MMEKPPATRQSTYFKWLLRLILGLVLVGALIAWQGVGVKRALSSVSPLSLLGVVIFYLATQLISAAKWQLLINTLLHGEKTRPTQSTSGEDLSLLECYRLYLIGMFWNLWMPTAIGGDAMRAYFAGQHTRNLPVAASSIFAERLTGLVMLMTIGAAGLVLQILASTGQSSTRAWSTLLLAVGLLIVVFVFISVARRFAYRIEARIARDEVPQSGIKAKITRLWIEGHRALDLYLSRGARGALWDGLAYSFVFQSSQVLLNVFLARLVGLELSPLVFLWLVPCLAVASMIPLGIGGLGVRETAAVALLQGVLPAQQLAPGTIIAWSLLWQAVLWLSALPGALAYALRAEKQTTE